MRKSPTSLSRDERLRRRGDITSLFAAGKSVSGGALRLVYRSNGSNTNRLLVTLRRKFGTAVERNRARRLVKEAYRIQKSNIRSGYDIGFVVYQKSMSYTETAEAMLSLLKRAGLYEN